MTLRAPATLLAVAVLAGCEPAAEAPSDVGRGGTTDCGATCDDGDPCTEDRCVDAGCLHVPRDANNACRDDRHCDDGDACTVDRCAVDACGLSRCDHALRDDDCRRCAADVDCVESLPCAIDRCVDGVCARIPVDGCEPRCDLRAVHLVAVAGPVTARGTAAFVERPCPFAEGCACEHELSLVFGSHAVPVSLGGSFAPCHAAFCDERAAECGFLELGRDYLVWGDARPASASDPRLYVEADGWCVAPTPRGLSGWHHATLTMPSQPAPITFEMHVAASGQLEILGTDRLWPQVQWLIPSGPSGQDISFTFMVGLAVFEAHLYPRRDGFAGPVMLVDRGQELPPETFDEVFGELVVVVGPAP